MPCDDFPIAPHAEVATPQDQLVLRVVGNIVAFPYKVITRMWCLGVTQTAARGTCGDSLYSVSKYCCKPLDSAKFISKIENFTRAQASMKCLGGNG